MLELINSYWLRTHALYYNISVYSIKQPILAILLY